MHRTFLEVDLLCLEEVIDQLGSHGDLEHIHIIAETLTKLEETRTRNEYLLPEVTLGNNLTILQIQAFLKKVGYSRETKTIQIA